MDINILLKSLKQAAYVLFMWALVVAVIIGGGTLLVYLATHCQPAFIAVIASFLLTLLTYHYYSENKRKKS